jgi:hypothetical protein
MLDTTVRSSEPAKMATEAPKDKLRHVKRLVELHSVCPHREHNSRPAPQTNRTCGGSWRASGGHAYANSAPTINIAATLDGTISRR